MALKVAELFAELGVDASQLDRGVDKAVTTASRSMRQVVDAAERAGVDAGEGLADGVTRGAQGIGADVEARFRTETSGLADTGRQLGQDAGGGIGGGILDGLPDLGGGLEGVLGGALDGLPAAAAGPALAVGAAAGAMIVKGVGDALEMGAIESRFEAALGVNEATAARMGEMAGDIYAGNFGESMQQVGESMRLVGQNFAGVGDLSEAELQQVNQAALTTVAVFDQDLRMTINAVSQLMRTGLAKDSTEAFDIITKGLQGPANKADDLLETFNEYSTLFRDLGINGEEALGLINQMVVNGARDSDVAADALGEFYKKATDGSQPVASALEDIGLAGAGIPEKLAAGGEGARQALDQTLDALRAIKDPLAQEQAGVALFGTQWEDLGDAILAADLDTAAADLGKVDGAAADAAESFDDLGSKLETLKRELGQTASDLTGGFLAPLAEAASDDATWSGMADAIQANVSSALEMVPVGPIFKEWGNTLAGSELWKDLFGSDAPEPPQGLKDILAEVRAAREAGDGAPLIDLDGIAASAGPAVAGLDQVNDLLELSAELSGLAADRADNFLSRLAGSTGMDDMLTSVLDLDAAMADLGQTGGIIGDLSKSVDIRAIAMDSANAAEDTTAVLREWIDVGGKAQQEIASVLEFQGAPQATARAAQIRDELVGMMEDAGYTDTQITDLLETMGLSDWQIDAAVKLSGADEAIAKLTVIREFLMGDDGKSGIPPVIESQIAIALSQDRAEDAANLLSIWVQDQEDGSIDNPLLIAMGLGDTGPASGEVDAWKAGEEAKPPAELPVGANTDPARGEVWRLLGDINSTRATIQVGVQAVGGADRLANASVIAAEISTGRDLNGNGIVGRAIGGPINAGMPYLVGELGPELVIPQGSGNVIPADKTAAMIGGVGGSSSSAELAALAAEVRALAASAARARDVTIHAPMTTTASPEENLRLLTLRAEQGLTVSGGR